MKVAAIVEGDGEVAAVPVLLRRLGAWRTPTVFTEVLLPIRVRRDRFLNREEEFRRHLLLAATKCGEEGWILVLLDAEAAAEGRVHSRRKLPPKLCFATLVTAQPSRHRPRRAVDGGLDLWQASQPGRG